MERSRIDGDLVGLRHGHLGGGEFDGRTLIIEDPEALDWPHTALGTLRDDAQAHAGQRSSDDEMPELSGHHIAATNPGAQRGFFKDHRDPVITFMQDALALHPSGYRFLGVVGDLVEGDDRPHQRAGVCGGLQQARDHSWLVDPKVTRPLI
jgi:hypothetical protein